MKPAGLNKSWPVRGPASAQTSNLNFDRAHNNGNPLLYQGRHCPNCAFFRTVELRGGHIRRLCQFTGERNPQPGEIGCRFLAGSWEEIDVLLRLTKSLENGKIAFPNSDRQSGGLFHAQHGKNNGFFDLRSNFPCRSRHEYKLRHNVQEPARAGGLSLAGERYAAFAFKTQNSEV